MYSDRKLKRMEIEDRFAVCYVLSPKVSPNWSAINHNLACLKVYNYLQIMFLISQNRLINY